MPFTSLDAPSIIEQIGRLGKAFANDEPGSRECLIDLSQALITALELPSEAIQRTAWAEPARAAHCRIAVDLHLFHHLKESGTDGLGIKALAEKTGAEEDILTRILKHLSAMHVVGEKGENVFYATTWSNALTEPKYEAGLIYTYDVAGPSFRALPEYLKRTSYKTPTNLIDGPFQYAHGTDLPFFAWLDKNPPYLSHFNAYMSAYRAGKPTWCDLGFYPVTQRLVDEYDSNEGEVLLVDVGGGLGHDLQELHAKHPSLPGKLVLQDRDEVINSLPANSSTPFEGIAHDFFTPQKIQHAKAYYLHSVLHDWGDEDCLRILTNLRPALKPGYSKILLNEIVVSEKNSSLAATSMDQLVLVLGAMRERTEKEWKHLLEKAGFRFSGIWTFPGVGESLIEAELA